MFDNGVLKIRLTKDCEDDKNTKYYKKGEFVEVYENPYSKYYHVWIDRKLDLIPKRICNIMGRLR